MLICASFIFQSANNWVYWLYDDTEHLDVAYNLYHGKGLTVDSIDIEANSKDNNIAGLQKYDNISHPLRDKPTVFFVLLGAWLTLVNANYNNWFFWGSIFNALLVSSFVTIFYFFTKHHFGKEAAGYSTPVLALMPALFWHAVRIRPEVLAFIFMMFGLFFAAKKFNHRNIVFAGVFIGLAHLTHPLGLIAGISVLVFLLLRLRIRAILLMLCIWIIMITPWMVRNLVVYGDATQGLGIPIPRQIAIEIGLISSNVNLNQSQSDILSLSQVPLSETLSGMLNEFGTLYGMQFFMLIMSISIATYISFPFLRQILSLRSNLFRITIGITGYIILVIMTYQYKGTNSLAYQAIVLLIPLVVYSYIQLRTSYGGVFVAEKEIHTLLAIFVIVTFIPYFMYAQITGRVTPEIRLLVYSFYFLLPLAIIGIKKLLIEASKVFIINARNIAVFTLLILILGATGISQAAGGIQSIDAFQSKFGEEKYQKDMHAWIIDNIPRSAKTASDLPHAVLLRTGLPSVNFMHAAMDNVDYERWIIKKFDIDYLIFYYPKSASSAGLSITNLGEFKLEMVYDGSRGIIYKIVEN